MQWALIALTLCLVLTPGSVRGETPSPSTAQPNEPIAGFIFGVPVPMSNYQFAKRVSHMFPRPWEEGAAPDDRERFIWEALILHYEAFRRGVVGTPRQLEDRINDVLKRQGQPFTRGGDPPAYARWVKETLDEDVALFENQMRYLLDIDLLKDRMRESFPATVTEQEVQEEFLKETHHIGGEMATFPTREAAQAFYERVKTPAQWDAMKGSGKPTVRPVGMMTLEAYIDLWQVPRDQIYQVHALPLGSVGLPMPFGSKEWCVFRLLDKRVADLKDVPAKRSSYERQLKARKQYDALTQWIDDLKRSARLHILPH